MLGCFVAGTAIMALGGAVAIENIRKGDMVLSRNDVLGITEYKPVTDIYVYTDITELTHVQYSDGDEIIATPNHPFYVFNRGYVEAGNLRAGDILLLSNGKTIVAEKIQHEILESPITVYNIEVAENSNYYVASDIAAASDKYVLVHNASCARKILIKETGVDMKGLDAHHQIPQKFRVDFGKLGIDVDNPKYLEWVERGMHNGGSQAYNKMWDSALKEAGKNGNITGEVVENIWNSLKGFFH
jgi:intein/homing endonuclease